MSVSTFTRGRRGAAVFGAAITVVALTACSGSGSGGSGESVGWKNREWPAGCGLARGKHDR